MLSERIPIRDKGDVLVIVDIQNDFCPAGALAVPGGDEVIPVINDLGSKFKNVILTQDWHPIGHRSFASSHPGRRPYDVIQLCYGEQILWPDHCIQGSWGALFHCGLEAFRANAVIRKGINPNIDSYSAFFENDRKTPTGLGGYLREREIERVFLAGLAFDFCVRYSALDARLSGFSVIVIEDACKSIDVENSVRATRLVFSEADIPCVPAVRI